jgi:hypothetical protein
MSERVTLLPVDIADVTILVGNSTVQAGRQPTNSPASCRAHMCRRALEPGCILGEFGQDAAW